MKHTGKSRRRLNLPASNESASPASTPKRPDKELRLIRGPEVADLHTKTAEALSAQNGKEGIDLGLKPEELPRGLARLQSVLEFFELRSREDQESEEVRKFLMTHPWIDEDIEWAMSILRKARQTKG